MCALLGRPARGARRNGLLSPVMAHARGPLARLVASVLAAGALLAFAAAAAPLAGCTPTQTHTSSPSEPSRNLAAEPELQGMVVGTIDKDHLVQSGYPLARLGDAFDAFKPDLVLVQVRPDGYKKHELEEGPFEMTYVNQIAGSRGIDTEPIDWYLDNEVAIPAVPDPGDADALKLETGWLDALAPPTFEQANAADMMLKIRDALDARARYLHGNPAWSRRVGWIRHNALDAMTKHKPRKVLAYVNILLRPALQELLASMGAVMRDPVDVVKHATESREGTVPAPVIEEWRRSLERMRDRVPRKGAERIPLLAKIQVWEVAVQKSGICCVPPNLLVPTGK